MDTHHHPIPSSSVHYNNQPFLDPHSRVSLFLLLSEYSHAVRITSSHAIHLFCLTNPVPEQPLPLSAPIPPNLREISSLASWTVSSSKPGCSIPQLRSPNTSLFWQSDGPQPHYLNIHFFKLVRIVGLRLYLDFEADESYTPTRIQFLAGSGANDLQEWSEMRLEQPRGWCWVDFSSAPTMPVLRAHLVQVKILENHQNGKDTHLRGLQIFARDNERVGMRKRESAKELAMRGKGTCGGGGTMRSGGIGGKGLGKSSWDVEPVIR
ncbi:APC10-domain-containing protein [Delitschia confertaspora ATCC 74209]|uniref:APC10-domain-containing protein n=1 Tax=Delitschia confertaspora ATCC 74209 TaxID=1513339 RepID=A0A9P4MRD2_9PLEO|nr:APC10-domain-containing protein [Delitschia confertaspora ATCC 74209]